MFENANNVAVIFSAGYNLEKGSRLKPLWKKQFEHEGFVVLLRNGVSVMTIDDFNKSDKTGLEIIDSREPEPERIVQHAEHYTTKNGDKGVRYTFGNKPDDN